MSPKPVFVIEDDPDVRALLVMRVRRLGHEVVEAASGEEALELAATTPPGAVVLDIGLPGIDGWEVLRRLRADPATAEVPVVVVSMFDPDTADDRPPVRGYVMKPFRMRTIDDVLSALVEPDTSPDAEPDVDPDAEEGR